MIYELEKLELFGIRWLNYHVVFWILTITCLLISFIIICFDAQKDKDIENELSDVGAGFLSAFIVFGFLTFLTSGGLGKYTSHTVSLSTIGDKITVHGEKVVVDKFDNPYGYESFTERKNESDPKRDTEQIFKFEYNELYESGKLITEKGSYYELSKEDARYLKERGEH
jgi:hypothetical protein